MSFAMQWECLEFACLPPYDEKGVVILINLIVLIIVSLVTTVPS